MDLTVQQLRYFLAVADELHFARAAERLQIAPSSLSQQISQLERRLRAPLFLRSSRRVQLTAAGDELLPLARDAVASLARVNSWVDDRRAVGDVVRIGLLVGTGTTTAILSAAVDALPGVRWDVRRLGWQDPLQSLRDGVIDVVITPGARPPLGGGIRVVQLWSEGRVLVASARHRLAGRRSVALQELAAETFVAVATDPCGLAQWFGDDGADLPGPTVGAVFASFEEVLDHCSAGMGVNIAGASAASTFLRPDVCFVPIPELPDVGFYLARQANVRVGAVLAFEEVAVRTARRLMASAGPGGSA